MRYIKKFNESNDIEVDPSKEYEFELAFEREFYQQYEPKTEVFNFWNNSFFSVKVSWSFCS